MMNLINQVTKPDGNERSRAGLARRHASHNPPVAAVGAELTTAQISPMFRASSSRNKLMRRSRANLRQPLEEAGVASDPGHPPVSNVLVTSIEDLEGDLDIGTGTRTEDDVSGPGMPDGSSEAGSWREEHGPDPRRALKVWMHDQ